jgi:hypothetical protein
MPELGTFGSVRGVSGNGRSYRNQHFSGERYFRHELPCDPSSLVRWRQRIGEEGCEWLLEHSIKAALSAGLLKRQSLATVIVDTTVQPKAGEITGVLKTRIETAQRLHAQKRDSKNKPYALHAPEVEYIAKGKARTPYEFGVKTSVARRTCRAGGTRGAARRSRRTSQRILRKVRRRFFGCRRASSAARSPRAAWTAPSARASPAWPPPP